MSRTKKIVNQPAERVCPDPTLEYRTPVADSTEPDVCLPLKELIARDPYLDTKFGVSYLSIVNGKKIGLIEPGDLVLAWDCRTADLRKRPVRRVLRYPAPCELLAFTLDWPGEEDEDNDFFATKTIACSRYQPMLTHFRGWQAAMSVQQGDLITVINPPEWGTPTLTFIRVRQIEILTPATARYREYCPDNLIYSVEVEPETVFVAEGVVLHHGMGCPVVTAPPEIEAAIQRALRR